MIKLYKREADGVISAYHEVWAEPQNRRLIEHWGQLGEKGEARAHRAKILRSLEAQFDDLLRTPRQNGFAEVDAADHRVLIVEHPVEKADAEELEEMRCDLEERLHETLGWTGLGQCESGDAHPDRIEAVCRVVDFDLAKTVLAEALEDTRFENYSRIHQEE